MPKKKKENEIKPDEQWERFKKAATDAGVDEKEAEKSFKRIVTPASKGAS
jgi:hypothetical protein